MSGFDAKACLEANFEHQVNSRAHFDINLNDHTGVKIVDLIELPAFRLNKIQKENFNSEF